MNSTLPRIAELNAPTNWLVVDFVSDLHLRSSEAETIRLWEHYLANTRANAIIILGDLFDVWVGDDVIGIPTGSPDNSSNFEYRCARILDATSRRCDMYFMHGNRDFLFGIKAAKYCGLRLLEDPTVLTFHNQRYLLTHGDALCLDDVAYQQFRFLVRGTPWQQSFLAKPLEERRLIAQGLREQSETQKRMTQVFADVDVPTALQWMAAVSASHVIHGHTHRPADQLLAEEKMRHVLSDWDGAATPERMQVLRLSRQTAEKSPVLERLSEPNTF